MAAGRARRRNPVTSYVSRIMQRLSKKRKEQMPYLQVIVKRSSKRLLLSSQEVGERGRGSKSKKKKNRATKQQLERAFEMRWGDIKREIDLGVQAGTAVKCPRPQRTTLRDPEPCAATALLALALAFLLQHLPTIWYILLPYGQLHHLSSFAPFPFLSLCAKSMPYLATQCSIRMAARCTHSLLVG